MKDRKIDPKNNMVRGTMASCNRVTSLEQLSVAEFSGE